MSTIQIINRHAYFIENHRQQQALKSLFSELGMREAPKDTPFDATKPTIVLPHSALALASILKDLTPPKNAAPIFFLGFQSPKNNIQQYLSGKGISDKWLPHIQVIDNPNGLINRLGLAA